MFQFFSYEIRELDTQDYVLGIVFRLYQIYHAR